VFNLRRAGIKKVIHLGLSKVESECEPAILGSLILGVDKLSSKAQTSESLSKSQVLNGSSSSLSNCKDVRNDRELL
jgi:hypothetical protein